MQASLRLFTGLLAGLACLLLTGCEDSESSGAQGVEQEVYRGVNDYRASRGLAALAWNEAIAVQCRAHSRNMADTTIPPGHAGYDQRMAAIAGSIPVGASAENVQVHTYPNPGPAAVAFWITSPTHRENIEGNFTLTGIGVAVSGSGTYYLTQIFVRP